MNVVGLFLPDPQEFIHCRLPVGSPKCQNGEFLLELIAVDDAELLDCVGRGAVLPAGTDRQVRIPDAVG